MESFHILTYIQPRPASYDPAVAIFERKERRFGATEDIEKEVATFLSEGSVVCGTATHVRESISMELRHPTPIVQPNAELLPIFASN
jgi:hypothetical protein